MNGGYSGQHDIQPPNGAAWVGGRGGPEKKVDVLDSCQALVAPRDTRADQAWIESAHAIQADEFPRLL